MMNNAYAWNLAKALGIRPKTPWEQFCDMLRATLTMMVMLIVPVTLGWLAWMLIVFSFDLMHIVTWLQVYSIMLFLSFLKAVWSILFK